MISMTPTGEKLAVQDLIHRVQNHPSGTLVRGRG
jgi:hypothetical protein